MNHGTIGYVRCPECGELVPLGARLGEIDETGNLHVEADVSDVWAHSWQHQGEKL